MAGINGARPAKLPGLLHRSYRLGAVALLALGAGSCAPSPSTGPTHVSTKEPTIAAGCTGSGAYRVVLSIPGSWPLLPVSGQGVAYTPTVGLAGTRVSASPATADLSLAADAPDLAPVYFNDLTLGSEAALNGYTIRITSICKGEVLFDLVQQPG